MHDKHDPCNTVEMSPNGCGQPTADTSTRHEASRGATHGGEVDEGLVSLQEVPPPPAGIDTAQVPNSEQGACEEADGTVVASTRASAGGWSPAVFNAERVLKPQPAPPRGRWRRLVYRASGGVINPAPSAAELAERKLIARVTASFDDVRRVAVLSRKGGVGKTTTTLLLGHTFAWWRTDRVVALDANPDAGNLAVRVPGAIPATVTSLLRDHERLDRYADMRAYTTQAPSRLEVVAADTDPRLTQALDNGDYRTAIAALERHYSLIVCDTGTGVLQPATRGVLAAADLVVLVAPASADRARVSYSTLEWLAHNGYEHLARQAVVAITEVPGIADRIDAREVQALFAAQCAAAVPIPWDAHLEAGGPVHLGALQRATRLAYLHLAAAVADGLIARSRPGTPGRPTRRLP